VLKRSNFPSSFRDNSGFVFQDNKIFYRQINFVYKPHYDHLMNSGLYAQLTARNLLISHEEIDLEGTDAYKIIKPQQLEFISYPYEWSFSMLQDAALHTLEIQKIALVHGMVLKDASAYNVQFLNGKPLFIDTLSFENYTEGTGWKAYGQFCKHFLAPLALMSYKDVRLNKLLIAFLDGIPLDLTAKLLPWKSRFNLGIFLHLISHSRSLAKYQKKENKVRISGLKNSLSSISNIIENLADTIKGLKWEPAGTEWDSYYQESVASQYLINKKNAVSGYIKKTSPQTVIDLGANNGEISEIIASFGCKTLSFDIDPACIEKLYLAKKHTVGNEITSLLLDVANPSPGIGWENEERLPFWRRFKAEMTVALALIHHLSITNNLPFNRLADFFANVSKFLVIEFVPKSDEKVQFLLNSREDTFESYTVENFEEQFGRHFTFLDKQILPPTSRILYLMERK
jgi:hypothetical protein